MLLILSLSLTCMRIDRKCNHLLPITDIGEKYFDGYLNRLLDTYSLIV